MMKNKLGVTLRLLFLAALIVTIIVINRTIDYKKISAINPCSDSWQYAYQIDSVDVIENCLNVEGWFFQLEKYMNKDQNVNHDNELVVMLENLDPRTGDLLLDDGSVAKSDMTFSGKEIHGIVATVDRKVRNDVNEYFKCEYDYSNSGFSAKFNLSDVDLEHGFYRVAFKEDATSSNAIQANAYIYNGRLSYTNPVQMLQLNVKGTELEEIVSKGVCLASCPDYHCNLYQYGWKLYWIVDDKFNFVDNGTYIQYQLGTTQFNRLPNSRTDNDWYWSNISDSFEKHELTNDMNCGVYRVSMRDLPNGFSVNAFETGYHNGEEWVWHISPIRPYYDFSVIPNPDVYGFQGDDVADWLKLK